MNGFSVSSLAISIGGLQALKVGLAQAVYWDVLPPPAWEVLKDFPVLLAVGVVGYVLIKLGERMLGAQQKNQREVSKTHQDFINQLLLRLEKRQDVLEETQKTIGGTLIEIKTLIEQRIEQSIERRT